MEDNEDNIFGFSYWLKKLEWMEGENIDMCLVIVLWNLIVVDNTTK